MLDPKEQLSIIEPMLEEVEKVRHSADLHTFTRAQQILLNRQSTVMQGLVEVLNERIALSKLLGN